VLAIEARGLAKSFDGRVAVDGVDLSVERGDIVALLGPNGAGKTTTLMMLLGVTRPDAAEIRLLGHPLPEERLEALARINFTASYRLPGGRVRSGHQDVRVVPPARFGDPVHVGGDRARSSRQLSRCACSPCRVARPGPGAPPPRWPSAPP
jgi:ABC-type branched-subunit amino acid transport system ATPase component